MDQVVVKRLAYSPYKTYQEHAHHDTQITLFVSGGVEEKVGDEWRTIGPLELVVKPAGLKHTNRFWDQGARTIQISLSPDTTRDWGIAEGFSSYRSLFCPFTMRQFLNLFSMIRSREQSVNADERVVEFFRKINPISKPAAGFQRCPPDWLKPVAQQINQEFHRNISVQNLAKQCEKHPVSLARAFRAQFGQSIKQRVCQLRVQRAAQQLCEGSKSAVVIAQNCGFSDQSHMNRVFKSVTGIPPVQFRRVFCEKNF